MGTATKTATTTVKRSIGMMAFSKAEVLAEGEGLIVPTLTFVEGTHVDALGKKRIYSQSAIRKYESNSNSWLDSGEEIPIFDSSHDFEPGGYSNKNKVGLVEGRFSSRIITREMLPKPEFEDLIGKLGLYTNVGLRRPDAIASYKQKLIKPISVGLMSLGKGVQVAEISIVPWGAVRGAMLFSRDINAFADEWEEEDDDSGTPENKPTRRIFALTLDGAIAERKGDDESSYAIERLTATFARVISSIRNTTDAELLGRDRQQLIADAIEDLGDRLRKDLNVPQLLPVVAQDTSGAFQQMLAHLIDRRIEAGNTRDKIVAQLAKATELDAGEVEALLSDPDATLAEDDFQAFAAHLIQSGKATMGTEEKEKPTDEGTQATEVEARFSALEGRINQTEKRAETAEAELARYKRNQEIGDRYLRLKQEAAALNVAGKFSRAAFLEYFPESEQLSDAVAKFSRVGSGESEEGEQSSEGETETVSLDDIEAALKYAKKFGRAIKAGSVSGDDPLPAHPVSSTAAAEDEADMARFQASRKQKAQ